MSDLTQPESIMSTRREFALALAHSTTTCNSFRLTITRRDAKYCRSQSSVKVSEDATLDDFAKLRLGPDTFRLVVEGAEKYSVETPTEYDEALCRYSYDVRLNAAGPIWLQAHWLFGVSASPRALS